MDSVCNAKIERIKGGSLPPFLFLLVNGKRSVIFGKNWNDAI